MTSPECAEWFCVYLSLWGIDLLLILSFMVFFFLLWIVLRCYGVFCCIRIVSHRCGTRCFSVIVWIPRMWERSCDCDLLLPLSGLVLTNRICALIARYVQVHTLIGLWVHLVGIV